MQGPFYHDTVQPFVQADESPVTLATTNKALVPAARYNGLGTQFFNQVGRKLRIRAFGKITTVLTPGNFTGDVLWGTGADANGTSLGTTATVALSASQTNLSWECDLFVHCRTIGSSGGLFLTGFWLFNNAVIANTLQPLLHPASAAAVVGSLDLTGTSIPSLQVKRSGSTAETMTVQDFELTAMN